MPEQSTPNAASQASQASQAGCSRQVKVCMLGAKGAGKTCFLAGLAVLSEPNRKSIITAVHDDSDTADYLDSLQATLRGGAWPPPTTATVVLDMTVMLEGTAVDLRVVDYAGEDFTGALRTLDRDSVEKLYRFTREADIFLLLFAPHQDLIDDGSSEKAKLLIERQRAHLQSIAQVWREKVGEVEVVAGSDSRAEIGLVITQCDRVPGLTTPAAATKYFKEHAPNLVERLHGYASSVRCFALSSIGRPAEQGDAKDSEPTDRPPASIDPFGYEPLFRWICGHHARKLWYRKPWVWGAVAVLLGIALAAPFGYREVRSSTVQHVLGSPTLSDVEKVERSSGWVNEATARRRSGFLRDVLLVWEERLMAATSDDDFQRLAQEVQLLVACDTGSFRPQFREFAERIRMRERRVRLDSLVDGFDAQPRPTGFVDQCRQFVDEYRSGEDVKKVQEMLVAIGGELIQARRDAIKIMPVGTANQVLAKANEILEFTKKFERQLPEDEVSGMRRAAEVARLASGQGQWEVTLVRSGGLTVPYWQTVILAKSRGGDVIHTFDGSSGGATQDKTWSSSPVQIAWKAGDPLSVKLKVEGRAWDVDIGYLQDNGPMAIGLFVGRRFLNVETGSESYVTEPYVEFRVARPGGGVLTREDWQAVEDFIVPGHRW